MSCSAAGVGFPFSIMIFRPHSPFLFARSYFTRASSAGRSSLRMGVNIDHHIYTLHIPFEQPDV